MGLLVGYHASHEQLPPSRLLALVQQAERAGFGAAMCSDHFAPWLPEQGESGYAWAWLGAALATTDLSFGTVNAPGQRYHPAIVAQKAATLCEMFPGRFWLAVGSGEALNEHVTGDPWPPKAERNARLKECVDVMRALWRGETVTHEGRVRVDRAKLYTRPATPPLVVGAATTPETARWLGGWADALVTVSKPIPELRRVVEAFEAGGGRGKPLFLQAQVSYAATDREALEAAFRSWRFAAFGGDVLWNLEMPEQFVERTRDVSEDALRKAILVSSDLDEHVAKLEECASLGFSRIYVHQVAPDQERFLRGYGERVLPALARRA